jgi:glucose/arabinose dehydrogenase
MRSWIFYVVLITACSAPPTDGPTWETDEARDDKADSPLCPPGGGDGVQLARAFTPRFSLPVALLQAPGDASRFFVVEKGGRVKVLTRGAPAASLFVDLTDRVSATANEAGLLGMAFHPAFARNGQVILSYTAAAGSTGLQSRISRFTSSDGGRTLDPSTEEILLTIDQPFVNHNGGNVVFGPDGFLYAGYGDGGSAGDPNSNGQNVNVLLGKMLRLDVDGAQPYAIPPSNPFARGGGRAEIYAWGLRNPWRWSFDRANGDLWAGDVGQDKFEEIDQIEVGGNYGWNAREGLHCFSAQCNLNGLIDPVVEYTHSDGNAVIGGYVYRGNSIRSLAGIYIYGDNGSGKIWGLFRDPVTGRAAPQVLLESGKSISSFAEDAAGELYVLDYASGVVFALQAAACSVTVGPGLGGRTVDLGAPPDLSPSGPAPQFLVRDGIGTEAEANQYYSSIIGNFRPGVVTLDLWKSAFLTGRATFSAFYRNTSDLGFWREMTCTQSIGKGIGGCMVTNWRNPDDKDNGKPNLGTVAMNVSRSGFTRFYVFTPDQVLSPFAVLDNEGRKFIPRLCTVCHAGGGTKSDLGAIFREFEPSMLQEKPGEPRAQAEAEWASLNRAVRRANVSLRSEAAGGAAGVDHARAAMIAYLDEIYSSPGVSRDVRDPAHVPPSWRSGPPARASLFTALVNPYCMTCHRTNTVDFSDYNTWKMVAAQSNGRTLLEQFLAADPSQPGALTIMPQARLTFDNLHADSAAHAAVDAWLASGP